ncbi:hypothetical protein OG369_42340 [Streptomyces sp. NBC_01221]|uniref:hypothetical protein n=1 Tax=Streptomyces sp. NBC_01221 TaxID=2903782 RepID=UPI00224EC97D|nr:hypothetical protein [Streptomyces sp. NBC_01221]MCX4792423.1 hypothetical protein [Streptomyces sp. NBC_01221]
MLARSGYYAVITGRGNARCAHGRIEPVHYNPEHRVLEHRPSSPTQLRLLSRNLAKQLPRTRRDGPREEADRAGRARCSRHGLKFPL